LAAHYWRKLHVQVDTEHVLCMDVGRAGEDLRPMAEEQPIFFCIYLENFTGR
jgi:hypothetical protein